MSSCGQLVVALFCRELFEKAVEDLIGLFEREKLMFVIPEELATSFRQGLDYPCHQTSDLFAKVKANDYDCLSDLEPLIYQDNIFMPFVIYFGDPFETILHIF